MMAMSDVEEQRELLRIAELIRMGFQIPRLDFYRWLIENGHDPEWVRVESVQKLQAIRH